MVKRGTPRVPCVNLCLTDSDGAGGRLERALPPPDRPGEMGSVDGVPLTHGSADPDTVLPLSEVPPDVGRNLVSGPESRSRLRR